VDDALSDATSFTQNREESTRAARGRALDAVADDDTIVQRDRGKQFGTSFASGLPLLSLQTTDLHPILHFESSADCVFLFLFPLSIALPCSNMIALFYIYSTGRTGQSSAESVSEERKTCRQRGYRYVRQWRHGQCSDERLCRTRAVCTEFASASRDAPLCSPFAPIRRVPAAVRAGESRSDVDRVERGSQSDSAGSGPRLLLSSSHSFSFSCFIS